MTTNAPSHPRLRRWLTWAGALVVVCVALVGAYLLFDRLRPRDPMEQGRAAYALAHWEEAESFARTALHAAPADKDALRLLARASARLKRDETAQTLFQQLDIQKADAEDLYLVASTLLRQSQNAPAMRMLERALVLDPHHAETLLALGDLYQRVDFPRAAIDVLNVLIDLKAHAIEANWLLGRAAQAVGDVRLAATAYRRLAELPPQSLPSGVSAAELHRRLARAELQLGDHAAALKSLATLDPDPTAGELAWLRGRAFLLAGDLKSFQNVEAQSNAYRIAHPEANEPAPYAGSGSCAECHPAVSQSHRSGHHMKTFARTTELAPGVPLVETWTPDPTDQRLRYRIGLDANRVRVEVQTTDATLSALATYALGSGNRGKSLIVRDKANQAREYRLTHYAHGVGWDLTMHHPERPTTLPDALGQPLVEDSVHTCVNCHVTDAAEAERPGSPIAAEHGVGCERCHGPGSTHIQAVKLKREDLATARPQLAEQAERMAVCTQCHRAPTGDSAVAPDSVRFPWPKLGQSRCYTESGETLDCVTCHKPHRDAEKTATYYESKCLECHGGKPLKATKKTHARCPVSPARDCLNCHMPAIPNAVPHTTFTDHFIRVRKDTQTP